MRMLRDPIEYGDMTDSNGDADLSGYINGFEVIPFPHIAPVEAPAGVGGAPYAGPTLFSVDSNGKHTANYEESIKILEAIFPKDKIIFVMCGGGGYAGMTKNLLIELGWDAEKIYNIGGYWSYEGKNSISTVLRVESDQTRVFDFSSVPYHDIDFSVLTEK
jgi:rhodanese-related sulfurtransferase